ncbi:MAG: O-antigen ligase family protein [Glaciecola sp.]|jgi:hypothetical protein
MFSAAFFMITFFSTIVLSIRQSALYIFVLYQAYYFFNPPTKWWGAYIPEFRFSFYIVLTLLIIAIVKWRSLSENKVFMIPQFNFMFFTAFLYAIASTYAVLPAVHSIALDAILTVSVLVIIVYKLVLTEKHLDIILKGYVVFAGYMGYYISQFGRTSNGRFEGAGMVDSPDANGIGAALAPAILLCLFYFWASKKLLSRLLFGLIGIYLANALVQIGSRGAFLGVFVGSLCFLSYLYFSKIQRKGQRFEVITLLLLAILAVPLVTDKAFWNRMGTIKTQNLEQAAESESGSTRVYFWLAALDMAKDHPFGSGASGFIYFSDFYIPDSIDTGASRNRAVHSTWFEVLTEIGYLGLISFIGMIYFSFATLFRAARQMKLEKRHNEYFKVIIIGCCLLCFVISMTFLNRFRAEILYWCILFSAIAYNLFVLKNDTSVELK